MSSAASDVYKRQVSGGKEYYFDARRSSNLYGAAPANDVRVASIIVKRFLRVFK